MGMYVSFVRLTSGDLVKAEQDPQWAKAYEAQYYVKEHPPENFDLSLEKSWAGLIYLMEAAGVHFDLLYSGTRIVDNGSVLDGWDAELVKHHAKALRQAPFSKLAAHYDPAAMMAESVYPKMWDHDPDGELEGLRWYYEEMVEFFDAVAASGDAVLMSWG